MSVNRLSVTGPLDKRKARSMQKKRRLTPPDGEKRSRSSDSEVDPAAARPPAMEDIGEGLRAGWNYYTNILECMNDGVFIIDSGFNIQYLNKAAERVFGTPLNRKCYEYFHNRNTPCYRCRIDAVFRGKTVRRMKNYPRIGKIHEVFETRLTNPDGSYAKLGIVHDITDFMQVEEALRLDEARFEALFRLSHMAEAPIDEIAGFAMEQAVKITRSRFGFLGFVSEDETIFTRHATSGAAMKTCRVSGNQARFQVDEAGVWADAIRERRPIIINEYKSYRGRKGIPRGHVPLKRIMSVPVLDGRRVVALGTVANKDAEYNEADVRHLALLIDTMWRLVQRKEAERNLRVSESQLRVLSSKLLTVQEEERARLAHELHDSIGQTLVAVKFGIENALKVRTVGGLDAVSQLLDPLVPMVQNAVEEARKLYMGLRPTILDDFGAIAAIGWLCSEFEETHTGILVEKTVGIDEEHIPIPVKIVLFRTVQEALNNAARHSEATRVGLLLKKEKSGITLVLEDNGIGFDSSRYLSGAQGTGLGIMSMKERVELSGGTFSIESQSGAGTAIRAFWPDEFRLKLSPDFHL